MGLTANELSVLKRTGGSNPLASATQLNMQAPVAQRIEHLTTDQKVGSSNLFGRTYWRLKPVATNCRKVIGILMAQSSGVAVSHFASLSRWHIRILPPPLSS